MNFNEELRKLHNRVQLNSIRETTLVYQIHAFSMNYHELKVQKTLIKELKKQEISN